MIKHFIPVIFWAVVSVTVSVVVSTIAFEVTHPGTVAGFVAKFRPTEEVEEPLEALTNLD